jgi:hypothetical protein
LDLYHHHHLHHQKYLVVEVHAVELLLELVKDAVEVVPELVANAAETIAELVINVVVVEELFLLQLRLMVVFYLHHRLRHHRLHQLYLVV